MKKHLVFACLLLSFWDLTAQFTVNVTIPEVKIEDSAFEKILDQVTMNSCIQETPDQFFLVEFFLSDYRNKYFYVQIWPLVVNELVSQHIGGFKIIRGKYYLFPKKMPEGLTSTVPNSSKTICLKTPLPSTGPDYYFLIVGVTNDFYQILWNSCK